MKISYLDLLAFGPFTKSSLDFSADSAAFHMVYGLNEAGKSSALRALRLRLFGIPVRTPDSFLHTNAALRIGARLTGSDGSEIEFIRRKGNFKTLRGPDDETVLDEAVLMPFLGGVTQEHFKQMFAIGHDDLVAGGQEIVTGGGNVGQALFATGAGLIRLQRLQQELAQTCSDLFKPSGSKPRINSTISSLKTARKKQKEALLLKKTWKSHHQSLLDAQHRLAQLQVRMTQLKRKCGKLERVSKALPLIVRKKEVESQLPGYTGVPDLPEDFGDRRRSIENDLKMAHNDLNRIEESIRYLQGQEATLSVPKRLLQHAAIIEELQQDLGACKKGEKDRPDREGRMRTLQKQASEKLAAIGSDTLADIGEKQMLPPSVLGEVQDLGKTYERLTTRLETAHEQRRKLAVQVGALTDQKKGLALPKDMAALKKALQSALEAGPLEKQIFQAGTEIVDRKKALDKALERLPLWSGSLEDLDILSLPSRETLDTFESRFEERARLQEKLAGDRQTLEKEILQVETDLNAIALSHDVPTESDLESARSVRTDGWGLIRETLEGQKPSKETIRRFAGQVSNTAELSDAFEISMDQADQIADRLRREAAQVSKKGVLEARKQQFEKTRQVIEQNLAAGQAEQVDLKKAWYRLWEPCSIEPLSPREMRAWLADVTAIRDKLADLRSEQAGVDRMVAELESLRAQITQAMIAAGCLPETDAALRELIQDARTTVDDSESIRAQITDVDKELAGHRSGQKEAEAAIADLEKALAQWRIRWGGTVAAIGLDSNASPTAAATVIDNIREAKGLLDEAEVLKKRIAGIDRDLASFQEQVTYMVENLAPDLKKEPPGRAASLLNVRLTQARELQSKQTSLEKQIAAATEEHRVIEKKKTESTAMMEALCSEACCKQPEDLVQIENRSAIRRQLLAELANIQTDLRDLSAGATVDDFVADAASIEIDGVPPELERLAGEIETLEQEQSSLNQTIGTEKAELKRMDGSAAAAGHAEEAEHLLAALESDVEAYARTKIAAVILARTIERYRKKNQGPLIKRASELFSQMTLGSFSGVRADYDEKGSPVLVGIRPESGQQVMVAGMSDGTADQLYLALRLAGLEQFLETNEPLPFVVDDILLRFDDQRAMATLKVLAGLSHKTQVIFFTHHRHLVALASGEKMNSLNLAIHTID